jgi:hypothetical protein
MSLTFKIGPNNIFSEQDTEIFRQLLIKQGQVADPSIKKINSCPYLCIAYLDGDPVGIGAIKEVYKAPFEYAGQKSIAEEFSFEMGYLYVDDAKQTTGLKIGSQISRALLDTLGNANVFATTEFSDTNPMKYILEKLQFVQTGKIYQGRRTGKNIALYTTKKK